MPFNRNASEVRESWSVEIRDHIKIQTYVHIITLIYVLISRDHLLMHTHTPPTQLIPISSMCQSAFCTRYLKATTLFNKKYIYLTLFPQLLWLFPEVLTLSTFQLWGQKQAPFSIIYVNYLSAPCQEPGRCFAGRQKGQVPSLKYLVKLDSIQNTGDRERAGGRKGQ